MNRGRGTPGDDDAFEPALEVIDLGPDESPATRARDSNPALRRRRGPAIVAVIVVVALAVSVIASQTHHSSAARRASTTTTTDAGHATINLDDAGPVSGPVFGFRLGAQLLTGGTAGLRVVDTDTGQIAPARVAGLPPGLVTIVAHSGDTVAVRVGFDLYWFSIRTGIAHTIDGDTAFPAARTGRLWISSQSSATEVPGAPDVTDTAGPAIGATSAGLLISTKAGILLQPTADTSAPGTSTATTRMFLRAPATVIGVSTERVAWTSDDCGVLRCPVHITEVAGGATSSWLQLAGRTGSLTVRYTSAVFSPDGARLAISVPQDSLTSAGELILADLRSRVVTTSAIGGLFEQPARPGVSDANGMSIDWTSDGRFVLLAPANGSEAGRIGVAGPATRFAEAEPPDGMGSTLAAVGTSTAGSLGLAPSTPGPIATGGVPAFDLAAGSLRSAHMLGSDDDQVDVLDLAHNVVHTWRYPTAGTDPDDSTAARVTNGWLVVRGENVELLPDVGSAATLVGRGDLVFSAEHGTVAWIAFTSGFEPWQVKSYDPATGAIGAPRSLTGIPVGAVDSGIVVENQTGATAHITVVDAAGVVHPITDILDPPNDTTVLAAAGNNLAVRDAGGLFLIDTLSRHARRMTAALVDAAAFSPDGNIISWAEAPNGAAGRVLGWRIGGGKRVREIGNGGQRVAVTDDGFVVFTDGTKVEVTSIDGSDLGAAPGVAIETGARFALG